jgi:hypothetical protein
MLRDPETSPELIRICSPESGEELSSEPGVRSLVESRVRSPTESKFRSPFEFGVESVIEFRVESGFEFGLRTPDWTLGPGLDCGLRILDFGLYSEHRTRDSGLYCYLWTLVSTPDYGLRTTN